MRHLVAVLLVLGLVGLVVLILSRANQPIEEGDLAPMRPGGASPFASSEECRECHPTIYAEWLKSPHATSQVDPVFQTFVALGTRTEPGNPECQRCHHPAPVFQGALGSYPRARAPEQETDRGVTCLTCHVMGDRVAGTQGLEGMCQPIRVEALRSARFCGGCHQNQQVRLRRKHEWEEWRERSALTADRSCVDCHMDPVQRPIAKGGLVRTGHVHSMSASRNSAFLRRALDLDLQVIGRRVTLVLRNLGTGHRLPTGYRIRSLDIRVWVDDRWEATYRLHREPRWGGENTQLADGEVRIKRFPPLPDTIQDGIVKLRSQLKVAPLVAKPTPIHELEQAFPHAPRPLPEETVPPPAAESQPQETENLAPRQRPLLVLLVVVGVCLLLWLLAHHSGRRP